MRELSPDRPDTTESPYTVDAGHAQVELSFGEWARTGSAEQLDVLPFNLKLGLTNHVDLQFVHAPYERAVGNGRTDQGHGDAQVRLKVNLLGNDGGDLALAVMPYVTLPVGAQAFSNDDRVEGGLIVPVSFTLPAEFGLSMMAEVDFVRDGTGGYDTVFVHSASLSHDIVGPLAGFLEYAGFAPVDGDGRYEAYLDAGLTYKVNDDVVLDAGVNVGLNSAADDFRVFAGMTWRR
ncbi:MAG TPA: transporter, partial [Humisphaera sp.]